MDGDAEEDADGRTSFDEYSQKQSVLVVRTNEESTLSAPIDFAQIKSLSLPLARDDILACGVEAVRVSLKTAIEYIASLQRREDAAFPNARDTAIDKALQQLRSREGLRPQRHR